jgi:hypothetical protein
MNHAIKIFFLVILIQAKTVYADNFEVESKALAQDLKQSLMKNLMSHISSEGVESAISFCQINVKPIAKDAAKERINKFEFGRTSHKIRNLSNAPKDWMIPHLNNFKTIKFDPIKGNDFSQMGKLPDGKRYYVEPLFVQAQCLTCHGENVSPSLNKKITALYPEDKATGFKLNEFRGLIWIKEK